jgi:hypothetical protein
VEADARKWWMTADVDDYKNDEFTDENPFALWIEGEEIRT